MEMNVEKFLALTALLAASALPGCTVTTVDSGANNTAGSGTAGATGVGGGAGAAGSGASTGGGSGSASTEGGDDGGVSTADASVDSGPAAVCFAEGAAADGGTEGVCDVLPYANDTCAADDAGAAGGQAPLGVQLCTNLQADLKPAAFTQLLTCLKKAPGVADGGTGSCAASDAAAVACSTALFGASTCTVPNGSSADGGVFGCAEIAASCKPDDAGPGIAVQKCQGWLGAFSAAARQVIIDCYTDPGTAGACADKFETCVFARL